MSHERQQIREAVVAMLIGETGAGDNVLKSRLAPMSSSVLPTVHVYNDDEPVKEDSHRTAPRELARVLNLAIDGWCAVPAKGSLDDALDDLSLEIETAIDQDWGLDGTASDCVLTSTEFGTTTIGDRLVGCVHHVYAVTYFTSARVTDPVDDFTTLHAQVEDVGSGDLPEDNQAIIHATDIHE